MLKRSRRTSAARVIFMDENNLLGSAGGGAYRGECPIFMIVRSSLLNDFCLGWRKEVSLHPM